MSREHFQLVLVPLYTTGIKWKVHKTLRRRPASLLKILSLFNYVLYLGDITESIEFGVSLRLTKLLLLIDGF